MTIGAMAMPQNFKYRSVFERGRPQHMKWDPFYMAHPPMPVSNWAKIYAPFDALKGFNAEIKSKEIVYVPRLPVDEETLNRKLEILHNLTWNGRMARQNKVRVKLQYFEPVDAWLGLIKTAAGIVVNVDTDVNHCLTIQTERRKLTVALSDVMEIESAAFAVPPSCDYDWSHA